MSSRAEEWIRSRLEVLSESNGNIVCRCPFCNGDRGSESMWVEIETGDWNNGTGRLRSTPGFSDLKFDDLIKFEGGTAGTKAHYVGRVQ